MLGFWLTAKKVSKRHINYDPILEKSIVTIIKLAHTGKKRRNVCQNVSNDYLGLGWSGMESGETFLHFLTPWSCCCTLSLAKVRFWYRAAFMVKCFFLKTEAFSFPSCRYSTACNSSSLPSFTGNALFVLSRTCTCRHIKILELAHCNIWPPNLKFIYVLFLVKLIKKSCYFFYFRV